MKLYKISAFKKTLIVFIVLMIQTTFAQVKAEQLLPLLKKGSCPSGYRQSGNYCLGGKNAGPAVIKEGRCPSEGK